MVPCMNWSQIHAQRGNIFLHHKILSVQYEIVHNSIEMIIMFINEDEFRKIVCKKRQQGKNQLCLVS